MAVGVEEEGAEGVPFLTFAAGAVDELHVPQGVDHVVELAAVAEPLDPWLGRAALGVVEHQAEAAAECVLLLHAAVDKPARGQAADAVAQVFCTYAEAVARPHEMALGEGRWRGRRRVGTCRRIAACGNLGRNATFTLEDAADALGFVEAFFGPRCIGILAVEVEPQLALSLERDTALCHRMRQNRHLCGKHFPAALHHWFVNARGIGV